MHLNPFLIPLSLCEIRCISSVPFLFKVYLFHGVCSCLLVLIISLSIEMHGLMSMNQSLLPTVLLTVRFRLFPIAGLFFPNHLYVLLIYVFEEVTGKK